MSNLQALLDLVAKTKEQKEKKSSTGEAEQNPSPLESFIKEQNLEKGSDKIPSYIVYYLYAEIYNGNLTHNHFFKEFAKFFKKGRNGNQRYYLLNKSKFHNYRELRERAKLHEEERKNKKRD